MIKVLLSFISAAVGWATGFLFYVGYVTFLTPWGRPTDVEAILFWTGIFVVMAWVLVVLPFILLVNESSDLLRFPIAVIVGAIGGLVSFLVLVGWWTGFWKEIFYLAYAAIVGAVTGGSYAGFQHIRRKRRVAANS
jgi:hypothetical protein